MIIHTTLRSVFCFGYFLTNFLSTSLPVGLLAMLAGPGGKRNFLKGMF